jgi:hypothetical protein
VWSNRLAGRQATDEWQDWHSLLLGRFRNRLVRDGFFDEEGELWAPDGTLVAQSRQLGLLLEPRR